MGESLGLILHSVNSSMALLSHSGGTCIDWATHFGLETLASKDDLKLAEESQRQPNYLNKLPLVGKQLSAADTLHLCTTGFLDTSFHTTNTPNVSAEHSNHHYFSPFSWVTKQWAALYLLVTGLQLSVFAVKWLDCPWNTGPPSPSTKPEVFFLLGHPRNIARLMPW